MRLGKVNWRSSGSIHYSRCHYEYLWFMGRVKIPTFTKAWKKLSPTLVDDFEVFETSVKKVTADVKIARELGLEMWPEEVTELLKSHGKMLMAEELYLMDDQRILSNTITCMLQRNFHQKVNWCRKLHCCLILRNCHSHHLSVNIKIKAKPSNSKEITLWRLRLWSAYFSNKIFLIKVFLI